MTTPHSTMGPIVALLLSIFALSSATSQIELFTIGKEVVFNYETFTNAQADQPAPFSSKYGLRAKIHVQKNKQDSLIVRMENIVFNLENGPLRVNLTKEVFVPIPMEAEALKLPFQIEYNSNNKVKAVIVDSSDKEWSTNIKKSIASILQIDGKILETSVDKKVSHLDSSLEQTVYGLCEVKYNVLPREDHLTLIKTADPKTCQNQFNLIANSDFMDVDSNRVYKIARNGNQLRLEMIEARGDIVLAPFRATTEIRLLKVVQRLVFVEEVAISTPVVIKNQLVLRSLKFEDPLSVCRDLPLLASVDITGGRSQHNTDVLVPKVHSWIDQLVNLIDESHVTLSKPNTQTIQVLQELYSVLEIFDLTTLEHTFVLLQEQAQNSPKELRNINIFVQLLPHVGTRSSAIFVRNLIRKQKIDEVMAVRVLRDLPAHVRCPNEKLLTELEDLLTLGDVNSRSHRAGVLAFASLSKRVYQTANEQSVVLDKYIKLFMQKIRDSNDYNTKVLYVHALANIGVNAAVETLAPIITGEIKVERNLRTLTLWAVAPLLVKDPNLMVKYVWPVLSDRKLDMNVRTAAYEIYVRTEKPTLNRFMQLYWLMREETSERLYNFHYNTLQTMTKLKYFENNENKIVDIARTILRMSRHPIVNIDNEGVFINDFINEKTGLGGRIDNTYTVGEITNIRSRIMSRVYGINTEMLSVHLAITSPLRNLNLKEMKSNDVSIELIIRRERRVIMTHVVQNANIRTIVDMLKDVGLSLDTDDQNKVLEVPFLYERVLPSDLGVPVRLYDILPNIQSINLKMDTETNDMKFDIRIKHQSLYNKGMKVYNPINDLWHGIEEVKNINFAFGFSFSVKPPQNGNIKIIINKLDKDDVMGLQAHVDNIVYIHGKHSQELLSQFHKDSLVRKTVTRGDEYKKNVVIYNEEVKTLGKHVEVKLFDCDRDVSRGDVISRLNELDLEDSNTENIVSLELLRLHLSLLFMPGYGSCGVGVRVTPLESFDRMEMDVAINHNKKEQTTESFLHPFNLELDVKVVTKSVQNTDVAKLSSKLSLNITEQLRKIAFKWWIIHNQEVQKKLDIDATIVMKEDHVDGKLILSVGEINNLGVITLDIKGIRSEEQERILKEKKITYNECQHEFVTRMNLNPVSLECALAHARLNRYIIDVTTNDVENPMVKMILEQVDALRHSYSTFVELEKSKSETNLTPIHLDIVYPISGKELNVKIDTPRLTEVYTGIQHEKWSSVGLDELSPASLFYTLSMLDNLDQMSRIETCVVGKEHVLTMNNNIRKSILPNDWTLYLKGHTENSEAYSVLVKNVNGGRPLAVRVQVGNDNLELVPRGQDIIVTVNGKMVTPVIGKFTEESQWSFLMVESPKMIMMSTKVHGLHVIFDGRTVRLLSPKTHIERFEGQCTEVGEPDAQKFEMNLGMLFAQ